MAQDLSAQDSSILGSKTRLKKRAEFQAVARGRRIPRRGFVLQYAERAEPQAPSEAIDQYARFGFTVTKKVGNSVVRNRIRRRMREAVRLHGQALAQPRADHVLVGKREALTLSFTDLIADLTAALHATQQAPKSGTHSRAKSPRDPLGKGRHDVRKP